MRYYDIAVIGAGPAGATFARLASGHGRSVLLIDGQSERTRKPCGGLLAPDAQNVLAGMRLNLPKEVLVDPQIFSVRVFDVKTRRTRFYPRRYLNMDRLRFDRWLLSLVPDSVEILAGRVTSVEKRREGFLLGLGSGAQVLCRTVVGADGGNSMTRSFFLSRLGQKDRLRRYVAIQQWFADNGRSEPFYSCIFDPDTSPSCSWSAYKDGQILFGGCFEPKNCRAAFERQKAKLIADGFLPIDGVRSCKTEACLVCSPERQSDLFTGGEGIFLLGEAAGFISPSSYEGISYALDSGRRLAEAFGAADSFDPAQIGELYRRMTAPLRRKLLVKEFKRKVIFSQPTRNLILRTGVASLRIGTNQKA